MLVPAGVVDEQLVLAQRGQHLGDGRLQVLVPAVTADAVVAEAEGVDERIDPRARRTPGRSRPATGTLSWVGLIEVAVTPSPPCATDRSVLCSPRSRPGPSGQVAVRAFGRYIGRRRSRSAMMTPGRRSKTSWTAVSMWSTSTSRAAIAGIVSPKTATHWRVSWDLMLASHATRARGVPPDTVVQHRVGYLVAHLVRMAFGATFARQERSAGRHVASSPTVGWNSTMSARWDPVFGADPNSHRPVCDLLPHGRFGYGWVYSRWRFLWQM